jgi:hypothetical protein
MRLGCELRALPVGFNSLNVQTVDFYCSVTIFGPFEQSVRDPAESIEKFTL